MNLRSRRLKNVEKTNKENEVRHQPTPAPQVTRVNDISKEFSNLKNPGALSIKFKKFLEQNATYSLHKPVRKQFPRRRIIVYYPYQIHQMDLMDLRSLSNSNHNWNYLLVIIDLFTKKVWLSKLKTKGGVEVCDAIKGCFEKMEMPPQTVIFDEGLEFYNKHVDLLFLQYNIHYYSIKTIKKASAAERVIKTLKAIMFRYFTEKSTHRWTNLVEDMENSYNNSWHSRIKMTPNEVTWSNRKSVFKAMYPNLNSRIKCKLKEGDKVRVALHKATFAKSYTVNWSEKIFTISQIYQRSGVCWYKIKDANGEAYPKKKYFYQLNLVASS